MRSLAGLLVAATWLVHGLFNKLLGGSPRHLAIVQAVPGLGGSTGEHVLTVVGVFEVALALWVLTGWTPVLCAAAQTLALMSMNILELTYARDLLLWPAGLIPVNLAFLGLAWTPAMARLRRHPLAIEAHFTECVTLTYAVPPEVLRPLVPPGLELDTFGESGFLAVALVQTTGLRPAGLPNAVGQDFFLAGYRVFTKFRVPGAGSVRGLRILRSDADRRRMVLAGNLLTHYHYHYGRVRIDRSDGRLDLRVRTDDGGGDLALTARLSGRALPEGSRFTSWQEARRFAGPMPFTFDYEPETHGILAIEARRTMWRPLPIEVDVHRIAFLEGAAFAGCTPVLSAAFRVSNVDYRWERGVFHQLARSPGGIA